MKVLDPIERVSEVIFGVLMAMTFIGSLNAASDGREAVRTMMLAALGCNLAWGLTDAVMYIVATLTERTRSRTLLAQLRSLQDPVAGRALLADVLPPGVAAVSGSDGLEALRRRLIEAPDNLLPPRLGREDLKAALVVFLLVALSTFPLVVPFLFFAQTGPAVRASQAVALAMLFLGGWMLARYSGGSAWRAGLGMAAIGVLLIGAIVALGG